MPTLVRRDSVSLISGLAGISTVNCPSREVTVSQFPRSAASSGVAIKRQATIHRQRNITVLPTRQRVQVGVQHIMNAARRNEQLACFTDEIDQLRPRDERCSQRMRCTSAVVSGA